MLASRRSALRTALAHRPSEGSQLPPPEALEPPRLAAPFHGSKEPVRWERLRLSLDSLPPPRSHAHGEAAADPGAATVTLLLARPGQEQRSSATLPVVLLLHPTGKCKEYVAEHLERYARQGYLAAAFDARYHGERALPQAGLSEEPDALSLAAIGPAMVERIIETEPRRLKVYHEALVSAWRTGAERPFLFDTVSDAFQIIDYLAARDDVDDARIGVVGVSLGGMAAWLLAAADERVASAAPAIGVQSFRFALDHNLWGARVDTIRPVFEAAARDLGRPDVDTAVVEAVWKRLVPGLAAAGPEDSAAAFDGPATLPCIAPRHLLVLSGEDDPRCPLEGVRLAVAAAAPYYDDSSRLAKSRLRHFVDLGVGHEMTENMWREIDAFLAETLLTSDATPPPKRAKM